MKKVILLVATCVMLFGESEGFYKSKYEYLVGKHTIMDEKLKLNHKEHITAVVESFKAVGARDQRDAEEIEHRLEQDGKDLAKQKSDYEDKIMDLKFKMQDDLKIIPEWFTFMPK